MISIQVVPPQFVYHVWDRIKHYLERGLEHSAGEYTAEQLKVYLTQGTQTLVLIMDGSDIKGAVTISWTNHPNDRIAFITSVGGKGIIDQAGWQEFTDWCRTQGATAIRGCVTESAARLWRRAFKTQKRYIVVENRL